MRIILNISRCRHCNNMSFCDEDGTDLDGPICAITGCNVNDDDSCESFLLCKDVEKELKETLGFNESEIKIEN